MNRCNSLDQETVDVGSINSFKGRLDKIRKTRMGFLWILHGPQSPRPHGDWTPVRPHKVSYKVSYNDDDDDESMALILSHIARFSGMVKICTLLSAA